MAERLYELVAEFAALTGEETVYDLYCALENAELNGIANAAFFAGEVGQALAELTDRAGPPDVVVVDPPRAGLAGKALRRIGKLAPPRLVYVSCNPPTLAGNVKQL